jgi:hypothetical protein
MANARLTLRAIAMIRLLRGTVSADLRCGGVTRSVAAEVAA